MTLADWNDSLAQPDHRLPRFREAVTMLRARCSRIVNVASVTGPLVATAARRRMPRQGRHGPTRTMARGCR
jgi:hypothetical protein